MLADRDQKIVDALIARLVAVRVKRGISQNRLSEIAGMSRSGLRHLESGENNPTLYSLLRIARALEIKLGPLLGTLVREQDEQVRRVRR